MAKSEMSNPMENINPWAEKLDQVSLPDLSKSWGKMEALLDREIPLGKNNAWRRWLLLGILLLLLIGVCNCPALLKTSQSIQKNGSGPATLPVVQKKAARPTAISGRDAAGLAKGSKTGGGTATASAGHLQKAPEKAVLDHNTLPQANNNSPLQTKQSPQQNQLATGGIDSSVFISSKIVSRIFNKKINKKYPSAAHKKPALQPLAANAEKNSDSKASPKNNQQADQQTTAITLQDSSVKPGLPLQKINGAATSDHPVKKRKVGSDSSLKMRQDTARKKGSGADSVQDTIGYLFALGINQYFPVGSQEKSNYNSNGTSGGIGDYIPVPVVRYYFHKWLYLQAEAQINTPQYTKTLLANVSPSGSGQDTLQSVFIKKLFYFNIPFSLHYSPFKNLFVGTGLQYSMLTNGVALFQNLKPGGRSNVIVQPSDTFFLSAKVAGLKNNPVYHELKTGEFRFLFDLNYQFKPLTVGLRYNQAFSNFINVRISNAVITQAHNASLQAYLRYSLWDRRKKYLISK